MVSLDRHDHKITVCVLNILPLVILSSVFVFFQLRSNVPTMFGTVLFEKSVSHVIRSMSNVEGNC